MHRVRERASERAYPEAVDGMQWADGEGKAETQPSASSFTFIGEVLERQLRPFGSALKK